MTEYEPHITPHMKEKFFETLTPDMVRVLIQTDVALRAARAKNQELRLRLGESDGEVDEKRLQLNAAMNEIWENTHNIDGPDKSSLLYKVFPLSCFKWQGLGD